MNDEKQKKEGEREVEGMNENTIKNNKNQRELDEPRLTSAGIPKPQLLFTAHSAGSICEKEEGRGRGKKG
jgi:hypothetical protein